MARLVPGRWGRIVFEAETEDAEIGYRRCFHANVEGMAGLVEVSEIDRRRDGK
jgi:hypothetical protein